MSYLYDIYDIAALTWQIKRLNFGSEYEVPFGAVNYVKNLGVLESAPELFVVYYSKYKYNYE